MRIVLIVPVLKNSQKVLVNFEVWGDENTPTAEGVILGTAEMSFPPSKTPEEIAEAVWEEALAIHEEGLASWELHNQVAQLLKAMMETQGVYTIG